MPRYRRRLRTEECFILFFFCLFFVLVFLFLFCFVFVFVFVFALLCLFLFCFLFVFVLFCFCFVFYFVLFCFLSLFLFFCFCFVSGMHGTEHLTCSKLKDVISFSSETMHKMANVTLCCQNYIIQNVYEQLGRLYDVPLFSYLVDLKVTFNG